MKTGLIVFGVVFLVLGALFFFVPLQTAKATTTTVGVDATDTRTSSATLDVPRPITYALLVIGLILLVLGFTVTDKHIQVKPISQSTTEIHEQSETGDGTNHKVTHERHVEHHSK